jgi:hypothetical protein
LAAHLLVARNRFRLFQDLDDLLRGKSFPSHG